MIDLYDYIDECKQGLHNSEFAKRLVELNKVRSILRDVISSWQFAGVDLCNALNERKIFAKELEEIGITGPSRLLSHVKFTDQELMNIDDLICSYIEEYFKAGIVFEENNNSGIPVTKEEYENYEIIKNKNPFKDKYMANAFSFIKAKCYTDVLKTLTSGESFGILDQVNQILDIIGAEFKLYFKVNVNSSDKVYLKYSLVEVDENGVSHIFYDPSDRIKCERSTYTRDKRLLNTREVDDVKSLEDTGITK